MTNLQINSKPNNLPEGFVYLKNYVPKAIVNLAYSTKENFVGDVVDGYRANKAIGSKQMAEALAEAASSLDKQGYNIVIYDSYRPQKAVDHFLRWSLDYNEQSMKAKYYPFIAKDTVFDLGFIAKKSGHSRGSTIDLTIIEQDKQLQKIEPKEVLLNNSERILWLDDNTVNMGSSFDLFHPVSFHDTNLISKESTRNRQILLEAMQNADFEPYSKEWWHYSLKNEPYPDKYFNFDIA